MVERQEFTLVKASINEMIDAEHIFHIPNCPKQLIHSELGLCIVVFYHFPVPCSSSTTHDTLEAVLEPFDCLRLVDPVRGTDFAGCSSSSSYASAGSGPVMYYQPMLCEAPLRLQSSPSRHA